MLDAELSLSRKATVKKEVWKATVAKSRKLSVDLPTCDTRYHASTDRQTDRQTVIIGTDSHRRKLPLSHGASAHHSPNVYGLTSTVILYVHNAQ